MKNANEKLMRDVQGEYGKWTISVDASRLPDIDPPATRQRIKYDKKFNLRIKQEDIYLLDILAENSGVPRSQIINQLLYDILLEDLLKISDLDLRLLLAETADQYAKVDEMHQSWAADALQDWSESIRDNVRKYNSAVLNFQEYGPHGYDYNSKHFHDVKKILEDIEK